MNTYKFSAVVILYNPKEKDILNLNSYISQVERLYIFDNSENKDNSTLLKKLEKDNYIYYNNKSNDGLCIPLNKAIRLSQDEGFDFLLTMDQDSYFLEDNIKKYFNDIINFPNIENVGQFGIWYKHSPLKHEDFNFFESRPYVITSGSVINLKAIRKHNIFFDENLFIDSVDFDFSFSIISNKLLNILFPNNFLVHNLGEKVKRRSLKSLYLIKKKKSIHSPIRMYYIQRNSLYLQKKYEHSQFKRFHSGYTRDDEKIFKSMPKLF